MGNPSLLQISGYCTGQTKPRARLDFSASTLRCTAAGQHQHLPAATAQVSWQQRNINLFCHAANVSWRIQVKTGNDKKKFELASWQKLGFAPQKGPSRLQQRPAPVPKAAEATEGPTHRSEFGACCTHNYKNKVINCYQPAVQYKRQQYLSSCSHVLLSPRSFASCKCFAQGSAIHWEALNSQRSEAAAAFTSNSYIYKLEEAAVMYFLFL